MYIYSYTFDTADRMTSSYRSLVWCPFAAFVHVLTCAILMMHIRVFPRPDVGRD